MNDLVWAIVKIVVGLVLLVAGGESLVRGASLLATAMRVSSLVIGLTVVAFGTSAPELAVSLQSAWSGNADLALGNVIGSNIFNILFILGLSAMIVPLVVSSQLIRWDVPVMIVSSLVLLVFGWNGKIERWEGGLLFLGVLAYTWWCIRQSRRESREVIAEFESEWPPGQAASNPPPSSWLWNTALIGAGLCLLGFGSNLLISGSVWIATAMGISQLVIGLTIVAVGTSLPEVVTSIMAACRGERDIAVGNVVGSNIFNILCVLGLSSSISQDGIAVSQEALRFDIPVMIAVAFACLPIFMSGYLIKRWEGGLFFFYYVAYTAYLVLNATGNELSATLRNVMLMFVIPLTVVTLAVTAWRSLRPKPALESVE